MAPTRSVFEFVTALTISTGGEAGGGTMGRKPIRFMGPDGVELEVRADSDITWVAQHGVATPNGSNHMLVRLTAIEDLDKLHEEFTRLAPLVGADPAWWGQGVKLKYGSKYVVRAIRYKRPQNKIELVSVRGRKTWRSVAFLMKEIGGVAPVRGRRRLDLGN